MNKEELIAFEQEIAEDFAAGLIASPVHLSGGNEDKLIEIFKKITPDDYVLGTWRSHLHCLLKGVPRETLKKKIHSGRSIGLCFPEHRILCSALVGSIAPIAVGIAWAIKKAGGKEKVWCFLGDMGARTGIVNECARYAAGFELPVVWIIENNGKSVTTDTKEVWGDKDVPVLNFLQYSYELTYPHVGIGQHVSF